MSFTKLSMRLAFGVAAMTAPLSAQFIAAGSLITPRSEVAATTLKDGRIFIAAGKKNFGSYTAPVSDCEFFTLAGGSLQAAPMLEGRFDHTLTTLANGKVLATGGSYADSRARYFMAPLRKTAEIFDPATGTWKFTGSMSVVRAGHSAALLSSGKVLIVGGHKDSELYTPSTGKFTVTTPMNLQRINPKIVTLKNGKLLILGMGVSDDSLQARTAEIYDPKTGKFTLTGPMTTDRGMRFAATVLQDGRVLVTGGDTSMREGTMELFDPMSRTFTFLGRLQSVREGHTATLLKDGTVMIAGGVNENNTPLATVERFYPYTMTAVPEGQLANGRVGHAAFFTQNSLFGSYFVLGGECGTGSLTSVESRTWR